MAREKHSFHTAHRIHYVGYDDQSDVWMTKDHFRVVAGAPPTVIKVTENNAPVQKTAGWTVRSREEAYIGNKWRTVTTAEIKDLKYRFRNDGY